MAEAERVTADFFAAVTPWEAQALAGHDFVSQRAAALFADFSRSQAWAVMALEASTAVAARMIKPVARLIGTPHSKVDFEADDSAGGLPLPALGGYVTADRSSMRIYSSVPRRISVAVVK